MSSTVENIAQARQRLRMKHGVMVSDRLLAAAEEDRTSGVYDRYLRPPDALVLRNPEAWQYALEWLPRKGNIFAWGGEGLGKSSMCRFLLSAWCAAGWPVMDLAAERIERELAATASDWRASQAARTAIQMAKRCLVLLIDDVTNVRWTPRGIDTLREIVNVRHENGKPLLITCQTDMNELHAQIGAIMEEVYSMSLLRRLRPYKELCFGGESYRTEITGPAWAGMKVDELPY